jgi:hypothetical protein
MLAHNLKLVKHYLLQPVVPQKAVKELRPFTTETPRRRELNKEMGFLW